MPIQRMMTMTRTLGRIVFLLPYLLRLQRFGSAFSLTNPFSRRLRRAQSSTSSLYDYLQSTASSADTVGEVSTKVKRVSVCMGELCQCQGEYEYTGGAADAALQNLRFLDLPFPIDEVGCMGACGMGTMIAIDYENGDSIMTDGLQQVAKELNLKIDFFETKSRFIADVDEKLEDVGAGADSGATVMKIQSNEVTSNKSRELADVRERMRKEANREDAQGNPWIKMATYLARKAVDNMLNRE